MMRTLKKENLELMQQTLELLQKADQPLSQPEIAQQLNIPQAKVWKMIVSLLVGNRIASIPKSQHPELFLNRRDIAYVFEIKAEKVKANAGL